MRAEASLLVRWVEAGDAGDLDAFDELLHPDVVVHAPLGLSTRGIESEKQAWRKAHAAFGELRHEVVDVVSSGDLLAARVQVTGRHDGEFLGVPATGRRFAIPQALFLRLEDGKAAEIWEIIDTALFLEQIGVSWPGGSPPPVSA
jgi:steroid delta-isomerase-like uncharacterized protein